MLHGINIALHTIIKKREERYVVYQKLLNDIVNSLGGGLAGAAMKLHEGAAQLNVAMQENDLAWRKAQTQVADHGLRDNHRAFQEMLWLLGAISLLVVLVIVLS